MSKENLGEKLRRLREEHKLPLRKVAALLDIDVAILSKMERGERKLNKEVVLKLAEIYHHDPDDLVIMYLSEKILYEIGDEELALKGLLAAEGEVRYRARPKELSREEVISRFKEYFESEPKVLKAWLFGSFVRGEMHSESDIDVMVRFDKSLPITFFDLAEVTEQLEKIANRKIDLVEEGMLSPFALKTATKDLLEIYG
ncbi:MAG TPA: nucleotidyltransferase domain-containing protein [Saprospiraceae bacterium]|nr:nucleotidyltransferase domain-containing protein [Saprospiraceae bacterium]